MNKKITMMLMFLSVFFMTNFELNAQTYNAVNGVHYTQSQTDVNAGNATYAPGDFELIAGSMSTAFITEWVTNDGQVIIPTEGTGYNYDITWTNMTNPTNGDGSAIGATGNYTIGGLTSGDTYEIAITGDFPRIYFNNSGDKNKIRKVTQWGDIEWTSMESAFAGAKNLEITAMDTPDLSNVESMKLMFHNAKALTGNSGNWNWDTENVVNMSYMFWLASHFNGDISSWNTGNVTNMSNMFYVAYDFNQDVSIWNTENVTNMSKMFAAANDFNQNLGAWDISSLISADMMFNSTHEDLGMDCDNMSATLKGWALNPNTPNNISLGASNKQVSNVVNLIDVAYLVDVKGWTIYGLSEGCDTWDEASTFVTEWVTNDGEITIPTMGSGYDYAIIWSNLTNPSGDQAVRAYGDYTISGLAAGDTYEVIISGDFPRIYLEGLTQDYRNKILVVTQWGNNEWTSMESAFNGAKYLEITAMDTPDLSNVESMKLMFHNAKALTGNSGNWNWNTESVVNMSYMFWSADNFNGDISNWNTGNVANMSNMFYLAKEFNQDISSWNTGNVLNMASMFAAAHDFNQNLGAWDISSLTNANNMFGDPREYLGMDCDNFSLTLEGWKNGATAPYNITLGALNRQITEDAWMNTIPYFNSKGWTMDRISLTPCDDSETPMSGFVNLVEETQLDILVYPNPTSGVFTLASEQGKDYIVMDIYGRTILQNKITDSKTFIDLSAYPRGMYYVQVGEQVARIVLK